MAQPVPVIFSEALNVRGTGVCPDMNSVPDCGERWRGRWRCGRCVCLCVLVESVCRGRPGSPLGIVLCRIFFDLLCAAGDNRSSDPQTTHTHCGGEYQLIAGSGMDAVSQTCILGCSLPRVLLDASIRARCTGPQQSRAPSYSTRLFFCSRGRVRGPNTHGSNTFSYFKSSIYTRGSSRFLSSLPSVSLRKKRLPQSFFK